MVAKVFMGIILILAFIMLYPYMMDLWTNSDNGFLVMMSKITKPDGSPAMSEIETSIWSLFPLAFLILGVGGIAWLMVRDKK